MPMHVFLLLCFCWGNQGYDNFRVGLQKYIITAVVWDTEPHCSQFSGKMAYLCILKTGKRKYFKMKEKKKSHTTFKEF